MASADEAPPETVHFGLRPAVAPLGLAAAGEAEAVCGGGVEGEGEGLRRVGVAETVGDGGPEYILVVEVRAHGEVFGGAIGIQAARLDEGGGAAQREASVADASVEVGAAFQAAAVARALAPRHVVPDDGQVVHRAAHPGGGDAVVAAGGPLRQLVAEDPGVGVADEDVVPRLAEAVESLREHHGVVSRNAVARAEPLVAHAHDVGRGGKLRVGPHVEALGCDVRHVVCGEHAHVVGYGASFVVGGAGTVDGYQDTYLHRPLLFRVEQRPQFVYHILGQQYPRMAGEGVAGDILDAVAEVALLEASFLPQEADEVAFANAFVAFELLRCEGLREEGQTVAPLVVEAFHGLQPLAGVVSRRK